MERSSAKGSVILFDGVCNLCNASVNFVIDRDPGGAFRFAALQGEAGRRVQEERDLAGEGLDSVVLVEEGVVYTRSTAALRIARRLGFPWSMLAVLLVLPESVRDWFYDVVARNRYRWFGRRESCRVPTPEVMGRFLD